MSPPPLQEMWLACPVAIKENHSEYCPGALPSIQGKAGVEGYPVNVIIIQDMSNKETLQQLWKKQALYIFQPSCIYISAKFYSCGTIMTPSEGPLPHISISGLAHTAVAEHTMFRWGKII